MNQYCNTNRERYENQSDKHRKILRQVLKRLDIETIIYENKGILSDSDGNLYKVSIRDNDHPTFFLDSSTFNKLKKGKKNAMYIVVVEGEAICFDINEHKYDKERQFVNRNTFGSYSTSKTHKWVTVFNRFQSMYSFTNINSTIELKINKPTEKTGLFQNIK